MPGERRPDELPRDPGGRFLSAPPLDADGRVVLDFHHANTPDS